MKIQSGKVIARRLAAFVPALLATPIIIIILGEIYGIVGITSVIISVSISFIILIIGLVIGYRSGRND